MHTYNRDLCPLHHFLIRLTNPKDTSTNARVKKMTHTHMPRWRDQGPHFRKMMEWIHLNTHIMGTTRKNTMETQTSLLNTLKNQKPHKGPVSLTIWKVGLLEIEEKGGQQQPPLPKYHICMRHINTKPRKTPTKGRCVNPVKDEDEDEPNEFDPLK
ncbi:hypothetical protein Fot_19823 [Forsythia ovata]|uniref:Uncharacterized protein n=1 Tax=Forsythia ovata TaxID=205694 RepID=A0ABD1VMH0_9LAMI